MRLLFFLLLSISAFAISSKSQTLECNKFKSGKFYYPTIPDKISWRKDSVQESYNKGELEMIWKVKWINECKYELKCERVLLEPYLIKKGDRIVATITNTDEDCFTISLIFYNESNPQGKTIPGGDMCIKKD
jgi:hypothetical protein